jgi:hypothetical protein
MALIKSTIVRSVRGFIAYSSASYPPALDQQHLADMLQVAARIASNAAGAFQLQGKRVLSSCREGADPQGRLTRKKDLGRLTSSTGQKAAL